MAKKAKAVFSDYLGFISCKCLNQASGNFTDVVIADISEDTITVDANHPLAGKTLIFDVELMEIT